MTPEIPHYYDRLSRILRCSEYTPPPSAPSENLFRLTDAGPEGVDEVKSKAEITAIALRSCSNAESAPISPEKEGEQSGNLHEVKAIAEITTSKDGNKLHFGIGRGEKGPKQLGISIRLYNKGILNRVFAKFGWRGLVNVTINGKNRILSRKDLQAHLESIEINHLKKDRLNNIDYNTVIICNLNKIRIGNCYLNKNLSLKRRWSLWIKMAKAVNNGNYDAFIKYHNKGSFLKKQIIIDKNNKLITTKRKWRYLHGKDRHNAKAYTLLGLAVYKGHQKIAKKLFEFQDSKLLEEDSIMYGHASSRYLNCVDMEIRSKKPLTNNNGVLSFAPKEEVNKVNEPIYHVTTGTTHDNYVYKKAKIIKN